MTRTRLTALTAAALLALGAVAGCGGDGSSSSGNGYIEGNGTISLLDPADRKKVGDVAGETLQGDPVSLADFRGKIVVVNVWGSWCAQCRAESDDLAEAAKQLAPEGVVFLGINTRENVGAALAYERRHQTAYRSIYDPGGRTLLAFQGALRPNAIPSTVVIDADGRVAASVLGELTSPRTLIGLVEDVRG